MTATQIHQINETHLGSSATPEQAQALAAELTRRGWPAEYCPEQGVPSYLRDEQTGDQIDIPDAVWSDAMASAGAEPPAADAQETQWSDSVARLTHAASTGPVPRRNLAVSAIAYADRLRSQGRIADGIAQMSRVLTLTGA